MEVHLVDGTYELFRQYYAPRPGHLDDDGVEVGALRGVLGSVLTLLEEGATHVGVATDHVAESFRNDLWDGYKTGDGIPEDLWDQHGMLEDALETMGVTVWRMVDVEADDGLASAARVAAADRRVDRVVICTPDKDLGQCVGGKVVQLDRRAGRLMDSEGVRERLGVPPVLVPDYLALVGDTADGFPGLPGFGAKSTAAVLNHYGPLEALPGDGRWAVPGLRGADRLAATFAERRSEAELFKVLATLRTDAEVGAVDEWRWDGAGPGFPEWCERVGSPRLVDRATRLGAGRREEH